MTLLQQQSSNPDYSVWVSASAGTGKTKVLIDRLVNLLYKGVPLHHIVCLTFTKAAAFEMRERLFHRISSDSSSSRDNAAQASILLETLMEAPESLKIMTVHGFCQSLLQKFPFEAGITPFFKILEEHETHALLLSALNDVLADEDENIQKAIKGLSLSLGEFVFQHCLRTTFQRWHKLRHLERLYPTVNAFKSALMRHFAPPSLPQLPFCLEDPLYGQEVINALCDSSKAADQTLGHALMTVIHQKAPFTILNESLLKKDGMPRSKPCSAQFAKDYPDFCEALTDLQHYLAEHLIADQFEKWLQTNLDYWMIVHKVLDRFAIKKEQENSLDYHDLILHCIALFSDDLDLSYIHQRLDYTIEHILVDEAQDNSPEQWLLIYKLVDLFIREDTPDRTLFIVGDIKQSIYGFQGAEPELFSSLRDVFKNILHTRGHVLNTYTLNHSFRTAPQILHEIDHIFKDPSSSLRQGMGDELIQHIPFRTTKGWIDVHLLNDEDHEKDRDEDHHSLSPLEDRKDTKDPFEWAVQKEYTVDQSQDHLLAETVATQVYSVLESKWIVPSTGNPIAPQDILILLRNRGNLSDLIIQALKQKDIPCEGSDRIVLANRLFIQDIMAILRFLNNPFDDWSLVHILKSPFVNDGKGFNENVLTELCTKRPSYLWHYLTSPQLMDEISSDLVSPLNHTIAALTHWLSLVDHDLSYGLISTIVSPYLDACEARLGKDVHLLWESFLETVARLQHRFPTLSQLVTELEHQMPAIKRDPTQPQGVRIMTIHGSKGLESPCVILVDRKNRLTLTKEPIVWPDFKTQSASSHSINESQGNDHHFSNDSIDSLICIRPKSTIPLASFKALADQMMAQFKEEENRLFYVALTRPRDGLLVVGNGTWGHLLKKHP